MAQALRHLRIRLRLDFVGEPARMIQHAINCRNRLVSLVALLRASAMADFSDPLVEEPCPCQLELLGKSCEEFAEFLGALLQTSLLSCLGHAFSLNGCVVRPEARAALPCG